MQTCLFSPPCHASPAAIATRSKHGWVRSPSGAQLNQMQPSFATHLWHSTRSRMGSCASTSPPAAATSGTASSSCCCGACPSSDLAGSPAWAAAAAIAAVRGSVVECAASAAASRLPAVVCKAATAAAAAAPIGRAPCPSRGRCSLCSVRQLCCGQGPQHLCATGGAAGSVWRRAAAAAGCSKASRRCGGWGWRRAGCCRSCQQSRPAGCTVGVDQGACLPSHQPQHTLKAKQRGADVLQGRQGGRSPSIKRSRNSTAVDWEPH